MKWNSKVKWNRFFKCPLNLLVGKVSLHCQASGQIKIVFWQGKKTHFTRLFSIQETVLWWRPWHACLEYQGRWAAGAGQADGCSALLGFPSRKLPLLCSHGTFLSRIWSFLLLGCLVHVFTHWGRVCGKMCGMAGGVCFSFVKWEKGNGEA